MTTCRTILCCVTPQLFLSVFQKRNTRRVITHLGDHVTQRVNRNILNPQHCVSTIFPLGLVVQTNEVRAGDVKVVADQQHERVGCNHRTVSTINIHHRFHDDAWKALSKHFFDTHVFFFLGREDHDNARDAYRCQASNRNSVKTAATVSPLPS